MPKMTHLSISAGQLPLDATMAVQLLDLFRDGDHDIDRIVDLISQNPTLAEETLRRCNNAVFHGVERTTDIFEAITRLGYYELYDIITTSLAASAWSAPAASTTAEAAFWAAAGDLPPSGGPIN
jgi:HD-like signal output (HDOD) protein